MIGKEIAWLFRRPFLIFMEVIPLLSLLIKQHLLSPTQHRRILINIVYFQMRDTYCGMYLGHPQGYPCGPDSVVVIATGYGIEVRGSNSGGGEIFRTCPDRP